MKVAVTGASGHIGINLIAKLRELGHDVRALYHQSHLIHLYQQWRLEHQYIDVRDPHTLKNAFADCEVVYHLAAKISVDGDRDGQVAATNHHGCKHVAEAALAQGVRRLIHTSSIHAFNRFPLNDTLTEKRQRVCPHDHRHGAYDRSKAQGEAVIRKAIEQQGLDAVIIHPAAAIGPLDYGPSLIAQGMLRYWRQQMPTHIAGGFNWVHVDDVVKAMITAVDKGRCGESYLVAGYWHSVAELGEMVAKITGCRLPRFTCPIGLARAVLPLQKLWWRLLKQPPLYTDESLSTIQSFAVVDDSKARAELDHQPQTIEQAMYDLFHWLQQANLLSEPLHLKEISW